MKDLSDICVLIQARLGSQRTPLKMTRPFAGTTLFDIACAKLEHTVIPPEHCYVSIYEEELKAIARNYGIRIFERSRESATCDKGMQVMFEWWDRLPYTYVVLINGCLPFLSVRTINRFIRAYAESEHDGMFAVTRLKDYFWNEEGFLTTPWPEGQDVLNTKAVCPTLQAAHVLYASRMDTIGSGTFVGSYRTPNDPVLFVLENSMELLDIDHEWEFAMCETLYRNRQDILPTGTE